MTARSVPAKLAPLVEELELRQPKVVTKALLSQIIEDAGLTLSPGDVAHRLQQQGWLLSLRTRDAWEFAPASRAGRIGSGDPLIELRATLMHRPDLPVAIAYESAAWLHGFHRRPPEKEVIALPSRVLPPPALREFRITRCWGRLGPLWLDELPTWRIETLLVLMGERPSAYRAWPTVLEWLPEAAQRADSDLILSELTDRRPPTWARTGYILEAGGRRDIASQVLDRISPSLQGPYYLGPRTAPGIFSSRWKVRNSILRHAAGRQ